MKLASLFHSKAKAWLEVRAIQKISLPKDKYVWIHCASVGEYEQAKPFIQSIKRQLPEIKTVLTFFSPSAESILNQKTAADFIYYLPLDTQNNALNFINQLQPLAVIWVKYEFWFNYLKILKSKKIPVYLVSAFFPKNHFIYSSYGKMYSQILNSFEKIYLQNESFLDLPHIKTQVAQSADTRYLAVSEIAEQPYQNPSIESFINKEKVIIFGSAYHQEIQRVLSDLNDLIGFKIIIVPHEVIPTQIEDYCRDSDGKIGCLSQQNILSDCKVLIIDSYGLLSKVYRYADIVYIGGGFNKGIHNILEPLAFGKPVLIGPKNKRFNEVLLFSQIGAVREVSKIEEIISSILFFYNDTQSKRPEGQILATLRNQLSSASIQVEEVLEKIKDKL